MKKTVLRAVLSVILALFLAISALAGGLCVYAENTLCREQLLLDTAASGSYAQELYEEIAYDWENLIAIAGVPEPATLMTDLTVEQVKADALAYLQDSYTGSAAVNTDALEEKLEEKVRQYAYSNTIHETPEEELEQHIDELVTACMQEYHSSIKVPLLPKLLSSTGKLGNYVNLGKILSAVFCVLLLVVLFLLQRKKASTLYYAALASGTNALLLMGAVALAEHYELLRRLPIEASALKTLIDDYLLILLSKLNTCGQAFLIATAVLLGAYLICIAVSLLLQRRKEKEAPAE